MCSKLSLGLHQVSLMLIKSMAEESPKKVYAQAVEAGKRRFSARKCWAPTMDCDGGIISAHTISRCHGLRVIARHGEVYQVVANPWAKDESQLLELKLRGVAQASTFNGFCKKHDASLFSAIENHPFTGTPEQVFLLMYRIIAKELALKQAQEDQTEQLKILEAAKLGVPPEKLIPTWFGENYETGVALGVREILREKELMDQWFLKSDFSNIAACIIRCGRRPDLVCSGCFAPHFDFAGQRLQQTSVTEQHLNHVFCHVIAADRGGWIVLSYFKGEEDGPQDLIDSLLATAQPDAAVAWLSLIHFENSAYRPEWWEALPQQVRTETLKTCLEVTSVLSPVENQLQRMMMAGYANWEPGRPRWINR